MSPNRFKDVKKEVQPLIDAGWKLIQGSTQTARHPVYMLAPDGSQLPLSPNPGSDAAIRALRSRVRRALEAGTARGITF